MKEGGKDTKALAEAAKTQAEAAKAQSEQAEAQTKKIALHNQAETSDGARRSDKSGK